MDGDLADPVSAAASQRNSGGSGSGNVDGADAGFNATAEKETVESKRVERETVEKEKAAIGQYQCLQPGTQPNPAEGGGRSERSDLGIADRAAQAPAGAGSAPVFAGWIFRSAVPQPSPGGGLSPRFQSAWRFALAGDARGGGARCGQRAGHAAGVGADVRRTSHQRTGLDQDHHCPPAGPVRANGGSQL